MATMLHYAKKNTWPVKALSAVLGHKRLSLLALALVVWAAAESALAQGPAASVEAFSGEPLGVGRVTLQLPKQLLPEPLGVDGLGLSDKQGRVLYPAMHSPLIGNLLKEFLNADSPLTSGGPVREEVGGILRNFLVDRPAPVTIYFLFRGDGPLEMTLQARQPYSLQATPRQNAVLHRRLLEAWWQEYTAGRRPLQPKPEYPPLVENYLMSMLGRRLNLRLPKKEQTDSAYAQLEQEAGVMLETEGILLSMEQDRALGMSNLGLPADQPLPAPLDPPPLEVPEPDAKVAVEPIAMHVPAECFYVRFGSFSNFLWIQDTLDTWGGDLQNLLAQRGLDYQRSRHMQDQLILYQTQLSRMLGETVISDVAIIGSDMYFREGAAYGFLFEARNSLILGANFSSDRRNRVSRGGVTEQKLKLAGSQVSLISAPDGSVRSYYAASGDYHFVTTSRALAERFLQVAKGPGSLGATKEFRYARSIMPLKRNDTVFVYFSDAFFRNITGPHYRVETMRRLESVADVEVVQLAKLASATEGRPGGTIEQLVVGGLLPADFGPRPDGSRAVLERGEVYDQLRGRRGLLLPVPDVPVDRVTAAEAASYRKFADFFRSKWGRLDPAMVGLKRESLSGRRERVVIDARLMPFDRRHVEFLSQWVGPADKLRLASVPGDMAAGEVVLSGQRLFGGLRDVGSPLDVMRGSGTIWDRFRSLLVGYVGSYGPPGLLGLLDTMIPGPADAAGYASSRLGLWRRQFDRFTVYSLQAEVLATVTPQLHFEQTERPAQARLHVGDIAQARVTPALNNWGYSRTRETALGNLRLMHALDQQLHVPPEHCKEAAEFLLSAKLICPLGGQYVFQKTPDGLGHWTAPALEAAMSGGPPPGYLAPPLNWFRGLDLDAAMTADALSAHATVIMQLPTGK